MKGYIQGQRARYSRQFYYCEGEFIYQYNLRDKTARGKIVDVCSKHQPTNENTEHKEKK